MKVIAASVGFASRRHFSHAFRTAYHTDPTAFRKSHNRNEKRFPPAPAGRGWTR